MSKRLMPTYLVNFLKEIYDGTIPSNFGKRMVSRQFIARVKELYETLGGANPSDYSRRMVNEYLIKFFNEIEIVEYTDDDILMTKTISSDLVYPACRVDAIGGMSYKSENLCYKRVKTIDYGSNHFKIDIGTYPAGTYYIKVSGGTAFLYVNNVQTLNSIQNGGTFTLTAESVLYIDWYSYSDDYTIMLNSGSTALPYQPYFEGIRDSAVTAVKTYNTDNELLDTYTVPSAITSLEGYGQSNPDDPTEINVVDFVAGKYYEKGYIDNGVWVSKVDEISISDNAPLLECEEGGTIVFENEYNQNMSNEVTTWIKES